MIIPHSRRETEAQESSSLPRARLPATHPLPFTHSTLTSFSECYLSISACL